MTDSGLKQDYCASRASLTILALFNALSGGDIRQKVDDFEGQRNCMLDLIGVKLESL